MKQVCFLFVAVIGLLGLSGCGTTGMVSDIPESEFERDEIFQKWEITSPFKGYSEVGLFEGSFFARSLVNPAVRVKFICRFSTKEKFMDFSENHILRLWYIKYPVDQSKSYKRDNSGRYIVQLKDPVFEPMGRIWYEN